MPEPKFFSLLQANTLLSEGAMGTMLHACGVGFGKRFDELNMTKPVRANLQQFSCNHIYESYQSRRQGMN
jgi:hypothetical protein